MEQQSTYLIQKLERILKPILPQKRTLVIKLSPKRIRFKPFNNNYIIALNQIKTQSIGWNTFQYEQYFKLHNH